LALAGISLIPPIAAYFALINNPRISFALRMNKYEAQQGLTAQKLQADLQAIGSAVQESLNETYRIKVEPKERADAERQRRLANSAVQSGVLAFEKDLDTITQSLGQQARETSAAEESPDAMDQRETELLNDLRESVPDLRSNAEKFAKLSDTFSPAEGEFVQEVFEPDVEKKLGRIVEELASEAEQGAGEDRRNIELALKHSYKESLLVDCWALRRGRLHHSADNGAVRCSHFGAGSHPPSLCTPLMAHGETLGILCLVTEPNGPAGSQTSISEFNVKLAVSVAEQAALSFANLKLREKLRYQSIRDPLTGLFNRRYLDESLERELPNAIRKNRSLGLIMLDVDRFKKFNDMFGHDAGDTVLRELGDYLAKFIRRGDLACRYGGEEFTLILPECTLEDTRRRADELRISFQQISIKHRDIVLGKVTLSLGVAALPDHGTTPAELLAAADSALLRAEEEGRDRVLIAEVSPNRSV